MIISYLDERSISDILESIVTNFDIETNPNNIYVVDMIIQCCSDIKNDLVITRYVENFVARYGSLDTFKKLFHKRYSNFYFLSCNGFISEISKNTNKKVIDYIIINFSDEYNTMSTVVEKIIYNCIEYENHIIINHILDKWNFTGIEECVISTIVEDEKLDLLKSIFYHIKSKNFYNIAKMYNCSYNSVVKYLIENELVEFDLSTGYDTRISLTMLIQYNEIVKFKKIIDDGIEYGGLNFIKRIHPNSFYHSHFILRLSLNSPNDEFLNHLLKKTFEVKYLKDDLRSCLSELVSMSNTYKNDHKKCAMIINLHKELFDDFCDHFSSNLLQSKFYVDVLENLNFKDVVFFDKFVIKNIKSVKAYSKRLLRLLESGYKMSDSVNLKLVKYTIQHGLFDLFEFLFKQKPISRISDRSYKTILEVVLKHDRVRFAHLIVDTFKDSIINKSRGVNNSINVASILYNKSKKNRLSNNKKPRFKIIPYKYLSFYLKIVECGLSHKLMTYDGDTLFHKAVKYYDMNFIRFMLEKKIDPRKIKNRSGGSVYDISSEKIKTIFDFYLKTKIS